MKLYTYSNEMVTFTKMIKVFTSIHSFIMKWVLPIIAVIVPIIILNGDNWGIKISDRVILVSIFSSTIYVGAQIFRLLAKINHKENDTNIQLFTQDEWLQKSLKCIPAKGTEIKLLIYTSYSLFSNFEHIVRDNPGLSKSRIKILLRDPDIRGLIKENSYSITRKNQLFTALDVYNRLRTEKSKIQIKFYKNEPWVRGMKINNNLLFYSTYSDKRHIDTHIKESEYSGSFTPWIFINGRENEMNERDFIQSFDSLFELIWNSCTKYKNIVFDLDGTLYNDIKTLNFLSNDLPVKYIEYICNKHDKNELINKIKAKFTEQVKMGHSGTESLINSINLLFECNVIELRDYLRWKDTQYEMSLFSDIKPDEKLVHALSSINENYNIFLLTNHTIKFTKLILNKLKLSKFFVDENILTIDKTYVPKPSSALIGIIEKGWKINISDSIFIGDREYVDLSYVKGLSLANILLKDSQYLSKLLMEFHLPICMIKEKCLYDKAKVVMIE